NTRRPINSAFTAALVCARARPVIRTRVFENAMMPISGETADEWWDRTGWHQARIDAAKRGGYPIEFDLATYFLHDVPIGFADRVTSRCFNRTQSAVAGRRCRLHPFPRRRRRRVHGTSRCRRLRPPQDQFYGDRLF